MSLAVPAAGIAALLTVLAVVELARTVRWPALMRGSSSSARLLGSSLSALASIGFLRRLAPPSDLRSRLTAAGEPVGIGVREWMALKVACALAALFPAALVAGAGPGRLGLLLTLGAPLAGFVLPDFWLARLAKARVEAALRRLPDMLDLLRVTVAAGVPPIRALRDVSAQFDGVLAVEWRRVAARVELGEAQDQALARLVERLPAEEVGSLTDALGRARRHGVPLADTLAGQASRARHARRHALRERAARAGPKIQLAVALLLVPAMLLMVAAVLASEILSPELGLSY
jgi:tight adherence protein C